MTSVFGTSTCLRVQVGTTGTIDLSKMTKRQRRRNRWRPEVMKPVYAYEVYLPGFGVALLSADEKTGLIEIPDPTTIDYLVPESALWQDS